MAKTSKPQSGGEDILGIDGAAQIMGISRVLMRKVAPQYGKKVGREWRFSRAHLIKSLEPETNSRGVECKSSQQQNPREQLVAAIASVLPKMLAEHGTRTSVLRGAASSAAPAPRIARRRRNGAPGSKRKRGASAS
jgi:hypothetical protein